MRSPPTIAAALRALTETEPSGARAVTAPMVGKPITMRIAGAVTAAGADCSEPSRA